MSRKPIDLLLDTATWKELPRPEEVRDGDILPWATHEGVLHLFEHSLRVYQLSDGRRIIAEQDLLDFFGASMMQELLDPIRHLT